MSNTSRPKSLVDYKMNQSEDMMNNNPSSSSNLYEDARKTICKFWVVQYIVLQQNRQRIYIFLSYTSNVYWQRTLRVAQYIVLQSNRQKVYTLSPETFIGFIHKSRSNILGGLQQESVGRHKEQQLIWKQQQLICKQQFIWRCSWSWR